MGPRQFQAAAEVAAPEDGGYERFNQGDWLCCFHVVFHIWSRIQS